MCASISTLRSEAIRACEAVARARDCGNWVLGPGDVIGTGGAAELASMAYLAVPAEVVSTSPPLVLSAMIWRAAAVRLREGWAPHDDEALADIAGACHYDDGGLT